MLFRCVTAQPTVALEPLGDPPHAYKRYDKTLWKIESNSISATMRILGCTVGYVLDNYITAKGGNGGADCYQNYRVIIKENISDPPNRQAYDASLHHGES